MIKPLSILIICLFVVIIGGVLIWQSWSGGETPSLTPTPTSPTDETADWQIYTNEEYGFSFKYPKWTDASGGKTQELIVTQKYDSLDDEIELTISVNKPSILTFLVKKLPVEFSTLRKYVEIKTEELNELSVRHPEFSMLTSLNEYMIGSLEGFVIETTQGSSPLNNTTAEIFFEKPNHLIIIHYDYEKKVVAEELNYTSLSEYRIIQEILSTFKFID
ncbi:hypothetical protein KJ616_01290 [Patescibacteria group bacterium]|nr:hypothetical protein [Patescibacteria group bacterium]